MELQHRATARGVLCSHGHFNHPGAPFCCVCGISMNQRTIEMVDGTPPPLGVIVLDDGATFTLDADYIVGRQPESDPQVASGHARALRVPDTMASPVHAHLWLDGWSVVAVDRDSTNGTFIADPGDRSWTPLRPNRPTPMTPGARILVGRTTLLYQSHQGIR